MTRQRRCLCGGLAGSARGRGLRRPVFLPGVLPGGTGLSGVPDGRNKETVPSQPMSVSLFPPSMDHSQAAWDSRGCWGWGHLGRGLPQYLVWVGRALVQISLEKGTRVRKQLGPPHGSRDGGPAGANHAGSIAPGAATEARREDSLSLLPCSWPLPVPKLGCPGQVGRLPLGRHAALHVFVFPDLLGPEVCGVATGSGALSWWL